MTTARDLLIQSEPFNEFDEAVRERFLDSASEQVFADGEVLYQELTEGDEIYFITSGDVRISIELASAYHLSEEIDCGPGELVGEGCFISDGPRPATVTALGEVKAYVWRAADWKSIANENPKVGYRLAVFAGKVLFSRVTQLREHLINDMSWGIE